MKLLYKFSSPSDTADFGAVEWLGRQASRAANRAKNDTQMLLDVGNSAINAVTKKAPKQPVSTGNPVKQAGNAVQKVAKPSVADQAKQAQLAMQAIQNGQRPTPEQVAALQTAMSGKLEAFGNKDIEAFRQFMQDNSNNFWVKANAIGNMGMWAGLPFAALPFIAADASTKQLQKMRTEDKMREAMGLPPLATNTKLAETALPTASKAASTAFSYSTNNTRVVNMSPKYILPGELPANSL